MCFLAKKWLNGERMFSTPKKSKKCGFWPRKNFQPNQSKYCQKTISRPKKIENVVFGPEKILSQIGQKMAEIWPKDVFMPKRLRSGIGPKKKNSAKLVEEWPKYGHTHTNMQKFSFHFFPLHSALHSSTIPYLQSSATVSIYYICIMSNVHILILIL